MIIKRKLIVGNWKMHKTISESLELAKQLSIAFNRDDLDVLICPTFPALFPVAQFLKGTSIQIGAQNLYWKDYGAFTGEVSGPLIKATGANYVLIGHSERRQFFDEKERTIAKRLAAAWRSKLIPILCIGELLEEREDNQTEGVLESQLAGALAGVSLSQVANLIIAYEPVWAIGTGKIAHYKQINETHAYIRHWINYRFNKTLADSLKILYGGSVNIKNAPGLLAQKEIDGILVGSGSIDSTNFLDIILI